MEVSGSHGFPAPPVWWYWPGPCLTLVQGNRGSVCVRAPGWRPECWRREVTEWLGLQVTSSGSGSRSQTCSLEMGCGRGWPSLEAFQVQSVAKWVMGRGRLGGPRQLDFALFPGLLLDKFQEAG